MVLGYTWHFPHVKQEDNSGHFGAFPPMSQGMESQTPNRRLDSWKSIATFFGRDERTVKRWERERALPVHRLPGARGGVYAYTNELMEWMRPRSNGSKYSGSSEAVPEPEPATLPEATVAAPEESLAATASPATPSLPPHRRINAGWAIAAVVLLALAVIATLVARRRGQVENPSSAESSGTVDPVVHDLYLKGRYYWAKRTPDDLNKAVEYFNLAIAKDPNYAPAYVGLADSYNLLREYTPMSDSEAYPRALAAARKAIELDPNDAAAHNSLAFGTFYWEWDAAAAEREYRRAIELDPNVAVAHHWYATFLMALGRLPESLREIERARQLDPASTSIVTDQAWIKYAAGQKQEGKAMLQQLAETSPEATSPHRYLGMIFFEEGDYRRALAEKRKVALLTHDADQLAIVEASEKGFAASGAKGMLESRLRAQKTIYSEGRLSPYDLAATLALLGRNEEALASLQVAYRNHDPRLIGLGNDFRFAGVHNDPAYRALVARVGLSPAA